MPRVSLSSFAKTTTKVETIGSSPLLTSLSDVRVAFPRHCEPDLSASGRLTWIFAVLTIRNLRCSSLLDMIAQTCCSHLLSLPSHLLSLPSQIPAVLSRCDARNLGRHRSCSRREGPISSIRGAALPNTWYIFIFIFMLS